MGQAAGDAARPEAPPTRLRGVLKRLDFVVEAAFRLRGLVCGLDPLRRAREAAAAAAFWQNPRFSALRDYERLAGPIRDELLPHYSRYVSDVSSSRMAVSLELAVLLVALCRLLKPRRLVDLGSGFSSALLRRYQQQAQPQPEVWSVDDCARWLEMTRTFLGGEGLPTSNLVTWDEFIAQKPGGFDLVLHDLGSIEVRQQTLQKALALAGPGAVVVLDDINYRAYRRHAVRVLDDRGIEHHALGALTRDKYGRYAMLATV